MDRDLISEGTLIQSLTYIQQRDTISQSHMQLYYALSIILILHNIIIRIAKRHHHQCMSSRIHQESS